MSKELAASDGQIEPTFEQVVARMYELEAGLVNSKFKIVKIFDLPKAELEPLTLFGRVEIDGVPYFIASYVPLGILVRTPNKALEFKRQPDNRCSIERGKR